MRAPLFSTLEWVRRHSGIVAAASLQHRGALRDDGWFESVRQNAPVDRAGRPIPWISYPALHFLERRIRAEMRVFEFGAGFSTLWWAQRVRNVTACESDADWYANLRGRVPQNVDLVLATVDEYPNVIQPHSRVFDVVVLDGGDRCVCARSAPAALNSSGVILWDDTDRPEYRPGFDFLRDHGFARIEFVGHSPIVNIAKETSIFYRPQNILGM